MSAISKSKWIISINKASYEVNIHVNAKLFFSSWRTMFVWSGNFQGHVCACRFTRPCIVHTEFWRLVIARWTRYNIMWSSLSVTCDRSVVVFSGYSGSSANKTDRHDITEILLKVALNTINQTKPNLCDMKFFSFLTFFMYMPSR